MAIVAPAEGSRNDRAARACCDRRRGLHQGGRRDGCLGEWLASSGLALADDDVAHGLGPPRLRPRRCARARAVRARPLARRGRVGAAPDSGHFSSFRSGLRPTAPTVGSWGRGPAGWMLPSQCPKRPAKRLRRASLISPTASGSSLMALKCRGSPRSRRGRRARRRSPSSAGTKPARGSRCFSTHSGSCPRRRTCGWWETGPETARLKSQVRLRQARIEWLGAIDDDERAACVAGADVFVAPSLGGESFGVVLLEAMAAGTASRRFGPARLSARRRPGCSLCARRRPDGSRASLAHPLVRRGRAGGSPRARTAPSGRSST